MKNYVLTIILTKQIIYKAVDNVCFVNMPYQKILVFYIAEVDF